MGELYLYLFLLGATAPQWAMAPSFTRFLDHTQRRTAVGTTPVDECSAHRRDLYLKTHTKLTTDKLACPRWDSNPQSHSRRAVADPRRRPRGHWDRPGATLLSLICISLFNFLSCKFYSFQNINFSC